MTNIQDVTFVLKTTDHSLAKKWLHNDIVKKKIATSYDCWIGDINDHKLFLTLREHIEVCIDTPQLVDNSIN